MTNVMNNMPGTDSVPIGIAAWLACLLFVMGLIITGLKLVREFRGQPEAAAVQAEAADRYVTKAHCDRLHESAKQSVDHLFSKLGGVERGAAAALGFEVRQVREERKKQNQALLLADIRAIADHCVSLPVLDTRSEDEILGYDENGIPS